MKRAILCAAVFVAFSVAAIAQTRAEPKKRDDKSTEGAAKDTPKTGAKAGGGSGDKPKGSGQAQKQAEHAKDHPSQGVGAPNADTQFDGAKPR